MNDYYDPEDGPYPEDDEEQPLFLSQDQDTIIPSDVDFEDPMIVKLPRVLLMGPRRGGKTSIQVCWDSPVIFPFTPNQNVNVCGCYLDIHGFRLNIISSLACAFFEFVSIGVALPVHEMCGSVWSFKKCPPMKHSSA